MNDFEFKKMWKAFLKERGLTQKKLALEIGIPPQNLSEILNGKRKEDRKHNRKIDTVLSFVREKYGVTFPDNSSKDVVPIVEQEEHPYSVNSHGVRFLERQNGQIVMEVPIVEYDALGSIGDDFTPLYKDRDEEELMRLEVDKVYHGKYIAFKVDGDSMDDGTRRGFERGDVIAVRELDKSDWMPQLHISKWPFWVVCWGNNIRLKQIVRQDGNKIVLHSLNPSPEYTDFELDLGDVYRLFNVISKQPKVEKYGL